MFGDEIWMVMWQGHKYKGDLTKRKAEALAEDLQRGLCKHKDFRDYIEIKRDLSKIKEVDQMYHTAKRGQMQTYNFVEYKEE